MANTKKLPSQCGQPGCEKRPTYGLKGSKKREFCSQHAKKGMINVNNKRCIQPDCSTIPSFAVAGSKKAEFCSQHAMEGMVDVRSKRPGTSRGGPTNKQAASSSGKTPASSSSSFSSPSERASGGLGLGGLRNNKRCGRRGCSKRPSYAPGASEENAEFCDQHATDGIHVGSVLRGLGSYRGGSGAVGKAGTGAGAGAGAGADDQRYSGNGLVVGTKRKHSSVPLPPPPVPLPPATSSALPYPLTPPEYLQGSSIAVPSARSNKRALAGAGGATTAPAALPLSPPLTQFRPPSSDRYTGAADSFQFRPQAASDRYLGGGESSLQSAALAATAAPLMQQFRPQLAERYALGSGDSSQQFRPQSADRYLGGPTAASTLPDPSSYSEDIASVFDKDVKL